jgi:hypothetical protein
MGRPADMKTSRRAKLRNRGLLVALLAGSQVQSTNARPEEPPKFRHDWRKDYLHINKRWNPAKRGPPEPWDGRIPLSVENNCAETIWPGVGTQHGTGPGIGGFELAPKMTRDLWVGATWQGRVWGRTNCTVAGDSCACTTGDCFGKLDCQFTVSPKRTAIRDSSF